MRRIKKPRLIAVGNHYIDSNDVACISKIRDRDLYIVRLKSQPNLEYPIWVKKHQIEVLIDEFDIVTKDVDEENEID